MSYLLLGPYNENTELQAYLSSLNTSLQDNDNLTWLNQDTDLSRPDDSNQEELMVLARMASLPDDTDDFEQKVKGFGQYFVINEQQLQMTELLDAPSDYTDALLQDYSSVDVIQSSSDQAMLDLSKLLRSIVSTTQHDLPWPEDDYSGDDLKAYHSIIEQLDGRVPKDDKGQSLTPGSLAGVTNKHGLPESNWNNVFNHIKDELAYFYYVKEWYSDVGYVEWFNQNLALNNFVAIDTINARYLAVPKKDTLMIVLDIVFATVSRGLGFLPKPYDIAGKAAGAIISVGWLIYKDTRPHAADPIKTTVADAKVAITNKLNEMTDSTEHIGRTLKGNWGKLAAFGKLIKDHTLTWPDDTRPLRSAAYRAYQQYAFQLLLPHTKYGIARFGVPTYRSHKPYWHPETGNYRFYTKTVVIGKDWWGRPIRGYYIFVMGTDAFICPDQAPSKLQKKMFGLSDKDLGDPELKLYGPDFYWHNHWKLPVFTCF